jgi:hypothetical protein
MFRLEEHRPNAQSPAIGLVAHFTNRFDAYYLLGKVFWCGCEFIAFTTYNIFIDFDGIFPLPSACTPSRTTSARTDGRWRSEDGEAGGR